MEDRQRPKNLPTDEITIHLKEKFDDDGNPFHFAMPDIPANINLQECFIIVFTGERPCLIIRKKVRPRKPQGPRQ